MTGPIRRDPRLFPLSHDHHTALARAREATLAVDGSVPPQDLATLTALAERCAAYVAEHLEPHFKREEKHLLPVSVARFGRDDDLVVRVKEEHAMVRKLTRRLTDPKDKAPLTGRLAAWAKALVDHVRFEEREWFEALQNSLPDKELERLGRLLANGDRPEPAAPKQVPKTMPKKAPKKTSKKPAPPKPAGAAGRPARATATKGRAKPVRKGR
jgi:hemerythrin-like domain-containing protein